MNKIIEDVMLIYRESGKICHNMELWDSDINESINDKLTKDKFLYLGLIV